MKVRGFNLFLVCIIFVVFFIALLLVKEQVLPGGIKYFPLNENDKYVYSHQEGAENDLMTITVQNVRKIDQITRFEFIWSGKYNDRIQELVSAENGIMLCVNKHLIGEVPLKTVRRLLSPLMMLPYRLSRKTVFSTSVMETNDYNGNFVERDNITDEVSFVGKEEVLVEAGKFKCYHFFVRHNYKDDSGNSRQMHTYNFWVAPGVGIVKFIHIFVPFHQVKYVSPEEKNIMNRYSNPFVSLYELKEAFIAGKKLRG